MWDPWSDPWTDSQLADPPLAAAPPQESSEDDDVPPPSVHTGLTKQVAVTMNIQQLAESLFSLGITEPGLLRILNNSGEALHKSTQLGHVSVPRMLYFQTCSWSHFQHMKKVLEEGTHDNWFRAAISAVMYPPFGHLNRHRELSLCNQS